MVLSHPLKLWEGSYCKHRQFFFKKEHNGQPHFPFRGFASWISAGNPVNSQIEEKRPRALVNMSKSQMSIVCLLKTALKLYTYKTCGDLVIAVWSEVLIDCPLSL